MTVRRWWTTAGALLASAAILTAVTVNGSLQVLGTLTAAIVDFAGASSTAPMKAGPFLPGACSVGQAFFKTDADPGRNIHLCTAANTWTQVQGGGAGSDGKPELRYISRFADFGGVSYNESAYHEGGFKFQRFTGINFNNPSGASAGMLNAGVLAIPTAATANSITRAYTNLHSNIDATASDSLYFYTDLNWDLRARFRCPSTADCSDMFFALGLIATNNDDPPGSAVGIRFVPGTDTNLMFYSSVNPGQWGSTYDTGVPPGTGWHVLRIRSDGSQKYKVWMSLDGGNEISVCASGCTLSQSNNWLFGAKFQVFVKTLVASAKVIQLDYLSFWMDRGESW